MRLERTREGLKWLLRERERSREPEERERSTELKAEREIERGREKNWRRGLNLI